VPAYEFRCRQCGDTFVINRSMDRSGEPSPCPAGHTDTTRLFTVAAAGRGSAPSAAPGGGCCGGGCGCG